MNGETKKVLHAFAPVDDGGNDESEDGGDDSIPPMEMFEIDDELREHVLSVQSEAFAIHPYPCIKRFAFIK